VHSRLRAGDTQVVEQNCAHMCAQEDMRARQSQLGCAPAAEDGSNV
jgi:hypothetical protein